MTARVAIILSARQIASREHLFLSLAERLRDDGDDVAILAAGPEPALRAAVPAGIALHDIAPPWADGLPHLARLYLSTGRLARLLAARSTDLVFATSIPPNIVALRAARRLPRRPAVIVRHSNVLDTGGARPWLPRDWLVPRLYPEATAIVAVSEAAAADLRRFPRIDARRVRTIANGVDLGRVAAGALAPAPHPWLADGRHPVLVAVGRLALQKDYPTMLRALAQVRASLPARLVIVGDGPERPRLEGLARDLGLADAVAFAGHVAEPFAFPARADLLVLSSTSEGMPSALIEALACGCPVVSTDSPGGSAEILDHGRYGWLAPPRDPSALAGAIRAALAAPRDPERLKARAATFDLATTVARYHALLAAIRDGLPA